MTLAIASGVIQLFQSYINFFVNIVLLIIFAVNIFYLSFIIFKLIGKNSKISKNQGNNSYKDSYDNFGKNSKDIDLNI